MREQDLSYQGLIETVPNLTEALERCYLLGGMRAKEAAYKLNIDYAHFQRMFNVNDGRNFPVNLIEQHMRNAGNLFPPDWLERRFGRCAYPLEFMQILAEIRRSLKEEGKLTHFALRGMQWPV